MTDTRPLLNVASHASDNDDGLYVAEDWRETMSPHSSGVGGATAILPTDAARAGKTPPSGRDAQGVRIRPLPVGADGSVHTASEAEIQEYRFPDEDDFHRHEYDPAEADQCSKCHSTDPPELTGARRRWYRGALVLLGAAPSLTWSCIYVSVAFFETVLGKSVLTQLGWAQDITALVGMLLYNALRAKLPYRSSITLAFAYKCGVCILIPVVVAVYGTISAVSIYVVTALNGLTTGVSQAQIGSVGGLLPGTTADQLILIGSSVASLAPVSLQALLLILHPLGIPLSPKERLDIMFPLAVVVLLCAIVAQHSVLNMSTFRAREAAEKDRQAKLDKRIGAAKLLGRLGHVKWYALGEVVTWTVALFVTAVTPYLRCAVAARDSYWQSILATVLLIAFNVCNFLGAVYGKRLFEWGGPSIMARLGKMCGPMFASSALAIGCMSRVGLAGLVWLWATSGPLVHSAAGDVLGVLLYVVLALSNGFFTVVLSAESQKLCGFNASHLCPIVGTIIWISMQVGVLGGIAVSQLMG